MSQVEEKKVDHEKTGKKTTTWLARKSKRQVIHE